MHKAIVKLFIFVGHLGHWKMEEVLCKFERKGVRSKNRYPGRTQIFISYLRFRQISGLRLEQAGVIIYIQALSLYEINWRGEGGGGTGLKSFSRKSPYKM